MPTCGRTARRASHVRGRALRPHRSVGARRRGSAHRRARRGMATDSAQRSSSAARTARVAAPRRRGRRSRPSLRIHFCPRPVSRTPRMYRPERLRIDVRAGARSDRLGDRVGLLGGEPALLDRKAMASPAAQAVAVPTILPCPSQRMNPRASWATPGNARPTARGSATTRSASSGAAPGLDHEVSVGRRRSRGRRSAPRRGRRRDPRAAPGWPAAPKSSQRRALRRVDRDLHVVDAHAARVPGGHQRELVGRQRPRDVRRDHERDPLGVALLEVAQQAAIDLVVALRGPRQRALERGLAAGADGHHQRVVGQPLAGARDRRARPVVDFRQRAADEARRRGPWR